MKARHRVPCILEHLENMHFYKKNIFAYPGTFTILRMYLFLVLILCNIISEQYPSSSLRLPLHLVV